LKELESGDSKKDLSGMQMSEKMQRVLEMDLSGVGDLD